MVAHNGGCLGDDVVFPVCHPFQVDLILRDGPWQVLTSTKMKRIKKVSAAAGAVIGQNTN